MTLSLTKIAVCVVWTLLIAMPEAAVAQADGWIKYRSENFIVYTPSSEGKARRVLQHLERVRRAYAVMLNVELSGEEPVHVMLFKNHDDYREYSRGALSFAYYTQTRGRDYIVVSDFTEQVERALNHEYFHLYAQHQGFNWPTWANEGFADYFSSLRFTSKALEVGFAIENHMRYLITAGDRLSAAGLFAMGSEQRHTADRQAVSDLYAMSWALVHFIFSDPDHQHQTDAMVAALQQTEDAAVAFQQVYGWSLDDVDDQIKSYVRRRSMGYKRFDLPEKLNLDAATEPADLAPWEAPLLLADLLTVSRHTVEAEREYRRLSELYPDLPDVDDSFAHFYLQSRNREAAAPLIQSAIEKGTTNPDTYKYFVYDQCQGGSVPDTCLDVAKKAASLSRDDQQLQFFAMHVAMRAEKFVDALLLANKMGKVSAEDAPDFFYQVAYSQYRLKMIDEAHRSIDAALKYTDDTYQRERLERLRASLDNAGDGEVKAIDAVPSVSPSEFENYEQSRLRPDSDTEPVDSLIQ